MSKKLKDVSFDFEDMVKVITLKELYNLKEEVRKYVSGKDLIIDVEDFFQEFSMEAINNISTDTIGFNTLQRITWCEPFNTENNRPLYVFTQRFINYYTCKGDEDRKEWQVKLEDLFNSDDDCKMLILSIGKRVAQCTLQSIRAVNGFMNELMRV